LSVLHPIAYSDYLFSIFKLFFQQYFN